MPLLCLCVPAREPHQPGEGRPLPSHAACAELRQMLLDGFDAVILVIPWGGFQVGHKTGEGNSRRRTGTKRVPVGW